MELKGFQTEASELIARRYHDYISEPLYVKKNEIVPFYQNLAAITGAGKTLVLADAIENIRAITVYQPIILWLSKGKVVVEQTLENLMFGKYADNIPNYDVKPLLECSENNILDDTKGLVLVATVGKFNQKDKDEGDRKIFKLNLDNANQSLWNMLKHRRNADRKKRELIIIYDEGHNLSDQQLELLLELKPDGLIAASATTKVPQKLEYYINRLKVDCKMSDNDLITAISNKKVVNSGLIKKHISIGGYLTPMELALNNLLSDLKETEQSCIRYGCDFLPKAIYVTNTNVLQHTSEVDNILVPFAERKARPIQIWKYLTSHGIPANEIAVYCNLKFDKKFPKPNEFNLYAGGESDYKEFLSGNYRHIIFNQSLQEGWDDPACYFAYIDKDMGSNTQVTQVIGRVLRQPGIRHYPDEKLNMANFYIKTDEKDVFKTIIEDIRKTLSTEIPEITISYRMASSSGRERVTEKPRIEVNLPDIAIKSDDAVRDISKLLDTMNDYRDDSINTVGNGSTIKAIATVGEDRKIEEVEIKSNHSNKVSARWVFKRELSKLTQRAVTLCDYSLPKFDALIEYSSNATIHIKDCARRIAEIYREKAVIVQNPLDSNEVGEIFLGQDKYEFNNSVHPRYSDFNAFELDFAYELDKCGYTWMRNPSSGFFEIPLLDGKGTDNFNPDFVVWKDDNIYALDTKGSHLIQTDSKRKLFFIENACSEGPDLLIRLISENKYNNEGQIIEKTGYTVWKVKQGKISTIQCNTLAESITSCLDV